MMPIDMPRDANAWVLLYDRDCGLCRWSLAQVLARDSEHRLRPVALSTPEADALLPGLTPEQRAASFHLVGPDGRRLSAGAAAAPLLRLLRGGRAPAAILAAAPRVTERAYRFVADHRTWFGRLIPAGARARADRVIERRQAAASSGS